MKNKSVFSVLFCLVLPFNVAAQDLIELFFQGQGGQAVDVDTEGRFTLMMMPDEDENFVPYAAKHEGHEIILNRSNTEATNKTITGKEQARLVNINNKWFIEDRSEMKTTFVRSSHPIELHSGDLILMGDRVFRFDDLNHPEEE